MSNMQTAPNPALRRVNATGPRLNSRRECIMRAKVLPNHVGTDGVIYQAEYSEHHGANYICKNTVAALGWICYAPPPNRTLNPRGGVFKPIGWVDLYLQQPNTPFEWKIVQFHVLDEPLGIEVFDVFGEPRRFDLIIGEAGCAQLLGELFDYEHCNFHPEEFEQQRQYEHALWEQQQLERLNLEQYQYSQYGQQMDFSWYVSWVQHSTTSH